MSLVSDSVVVTVYPDGFQVALVLGTGGIGSTVALALTRLGVSKVFLVDRDTVEARYEGSDNHNPTVRPREERPITYIHAKDRLWNCVSRAPDISKPGPRRELRPRLIVFITGRRQQREPPGAVHDRRCWAAKG